MTRDDSHRRRPPRTLLTRAAVGVGAMALLVVVAPRWWSQPEASGSAQDKTSAGSSVVVTEAMPAPRVGSVVPEQPVSARLPNGAVVPIRAVSTRADGLLDVPDDIRTAGWWRGGSRIGDPLGSTLLAAHVDSTTQGLGPYVVLLSIREGQRIRLTSASLQQTFRVTSLRLVKQGSLTHQQWIYSASGPRRLNLVTCAPPYDRSHGGYQNLAIVTAVPVGPPTPRGS